jgi:hypothetical protein
MSKSISSSLEWTRESDTMPEVVLLEPEEITEILGSLVLLRLLQSSEILMPNFFSVSHDTYLSRGTGPGKLENLAWSVMENWCVRLQCDNSKLAFRSDLAQNVYLLPGTRTSNFLFSNDNFTIDGHVKFAITSHLSQSPLVSWNIVIPFVFKPI